MAEKEVNPTANNLSELDPEADVDPLTDHKSTAQTPTEDEQIVKLPEVDGVRTGDFDETTGAAHPTADSGADAGVSDNGKN